MFLGLSDIISLRKDRRVFCEEQKIILVRVGAIKIQGADYAA